MTLGCRWSGVFGGAGDEGFAEFVLALFVRLRTSRARSMTLRGSPARRATRSELCRAARLDVAEENNFAGFSLTVTDIFDGGGEARRFGEFVDSAWRRGCAARVFFWRCSTTAQAMERPSRWRSRGDFTRGGRGGGSAVVEDGGDLAHFDKESGAATGEIIAAPMGVKMRSVMGRRAWRAGTKEPIGP